MFIGGLGIAILPKTIFIDPDKDVFFVGLFYNDKEVKYKNYKRQIFCSANPVIEHNNIVFKVDNKTTVFPQLSQSENVFFDSYGIFKNNELLYSQHLGFVHHCWGGVITFVWNEEVY